MGIFNWFNKKPINSIKKKSIIGIEDDYFGKLEPIRYNKSGKHYFTGRVYFSPYNKWVLITIECPLTGPTHQQKIFYTELQEQFDKYILLFTDRLHKEFDIYLHPPTIVSFQDEFPLGYIHISNLEEKLEWSIEFTTTHFSNDNYIFLMEGDKIIDLTIES